MVNFKDYYDKRCSLTASSLALYEQPGISAVWLGIDDPEPKVMASHAAAVGIKTSETTGWVDYNLIPPQVLLSTRMHLDRGQVEGLIARLQQWLETGTFNP